MHKMVRKLVGQSRRLFAEVFVFSSFEASGITSIRDYLDSCCFLMHLSGFLCILVILVVNFDVCGFKCLFDVRNSFGLGRRLFSVFSIMLFFLSFDWISVFSVKRS